MWLAVASTNGSSANGWYGLIGIFVIVVILLFVIWHTEQPTDEQAKEARRHYYDQIADEARAARARVLPDAGVEE